MWILTTSTRGPRGRNDDGSYGSPVEVVKDIKLEHADGVAFDVHGTLWVVMSYNRLGTVAQDGTLTLLEDDPGWLDYPTQPYFGTTPQTRTTLFLSNGGLNGGVSNIISFDVGVRAACDCQPNSDGPDLTRSGCVQPTADKLPP